MRSPYFNSKIQKTTKQVHSAIQKSIRNLIIEKRRSNVKFKDYTPQAIYFAFDRVIKSTNTGVGYDIIGIDRHSEFFIVEKTKTKIPFSALSIEQLVKILEELEFLLQDLTLLATVEGDK